MKRLKRILIYMLMMMPSIVFVSNGESSFPLGIALGMEAFVSIHMSVFVLIPLSKIISKDNSKQVFWILFGIRAAILLFCDFFVTPGIAIVDFISVFIGAFIVIPIGTAVTKTSINNLYGKGNQTLNTNNIGTNINSNPTVTPNVALKCAKCGAILQVNDKVCSACGTPFDGNNVQVVEQQAVQDTSPVVNFDTTYYGNEKTILKNMLKAEIQNQGENVLLLSTKSLNTKRNILLIIFGIITLLSTLLYFFNYSLVLCGFIEFIGFIIYLIISKRFNILNVLTKKAIKSPDEDLSKIVNDIRSEKQDTFLPQIIKVMIVIFVAIFIPCVMFFQPKLLFTRYGDGYQAFRYTRGIVQGNNEVSIPSTYKNKPVLAIGEKAFANTKITRVTIPYGIESIKTKAFYNASNITTIEIPSTVYEIRGDAFAYMSSLTHISLPEGLKEIRGGAFAYDYNLTNVKLPNSLEYLGGSAFSHCSSITEMTIPSKVTEINGETFAYMTSLRTINLHEGITYIHGEVFMGDTSLNNVKLPSKITEIKGSTFENCSSLTSIEIPEGVTRIGGHAFYGCSSLSSVYVPRTVVEIGSSAFRQCYSLRSITIPRNALVNERAFKESPTYISYYD